MLGDAPSLLGHLESNLKSNEFSKLSLTVRPRVIACYRDRFVCVFFLPDPSSSRSLVVVVNPFYLAFSFGFPCRFFFVFFCLAPAEEAAGIVPLSSQFQRDGSYIPSGLSGRQPWPYARKISLFPIFFFLHGLEFRHLGPPCFDFSNLSRSRCRASKIRARTHLSVLDVPSVDSC
jgi:hypothetical protein